MLRRKDQQESLDCRLDRKGWLDCSNIEELNYNDFNRNRQLA